MVEYIDRIHKSVWGRAVPCQVGHEPVSQTVNEPMVCCVLESHFLEIPAGHGPAPPAPKSRFRRN
jgi:hypothetical protein